MLTIIVVFPVFFGPLCTWTCTDQKYADSNNIISNRTSSCNTKQTDNKIQHTERNKRQINADDNDNERTHNITNIIAILNYEYEYE